MRVILVVVFSIFVVGCSSNTEELKIIKNHCLTKMKKTEKFCGCMVTKSDKNLSQNQLKYISINFLGNKKEAMKIKSQMSLDDFNRIGDFLTIAVQSCTAEI